MVDSPSGYFCSNLSGPFFLFSPISTVGFLLGRMIRQINFVHVGNTWALGRKREGACGPVWIIYDADIPET